jgi:hypothetical protein
MYILTNSNESYNLDNLSNEIDDIRYCVYNTTADVPDYYFPPVVFVEQFTTPAALLKINNTYIQMPLDWSMLVVDEEMTTGEIIPITEINDHNFSTVVYNPLTQMIPDVHEVKIANVFTDVSWFFPKLQTGSLLCVPLQNKKNPKCVFFVNDRTKLQNAFDISQLFG